jgi:hypothetical protein
MTDKFLLARKLHLPQREPQGNRRNKNVEPFKEIELGGNDYATSNV